VGHAPGQREAIVRLDAGEEIPEEEIRDAFMPGVAEVVADPGESGMESTAAISSG
jgi:hypothetical protein